MKFSQAPLILALLLFLQIQAVTGLLDLSMATLTSDYPYRYEWNDLVYRPNEGTAPESVIYEYHVSVKAHADDKRAVI